MTYAKRFYERDGEARIVIEATDADAPLFLLELIRTARGDPLNLQDQASREEIEFLHRLWPYVSPKSRYVDWETALGYLLVDDVYLVRNWAFSLRGITRFRPGR